MIDFDSLDRVLLHAERAPYLSMSNWVNECGTAGCLIGTFCMAEPEDRLKLTAGRAVASWLMPIMQGCSYPREDNQYEEDVNQHVASRFGITSNEAAWLFTYNPLYKVRYNPTFRGQVVYRAPMYSLCEEASHLDGHAAIDRLRRFIEYKKAKASFVTVHGRNGYIIDRGRNVAGISTLST